MLFHGLLKPALAKASSRNITNAVVSLRAFVLHEYMHKNEVNKLRCTEVL